MSTVASSRGARQRGVTLVELMVSLALGLFLVGVASITCLQAVGATRFGELESRMNEEGALALELLRAQLALAGYADTDAISGRREFTQLPVWGCLHGLDNTDAPDTQGCRRDGPRNEAIAVAYQATLQNSQAVASSPPAPGNCSNEPIAATAGIHIADNRFYVDTDVNGAPALYCRGRRSTGGFGAQAALVPNVERLHLRYAITRPTIPGQAPPHQVTNLVDASASELLGAGAWTRVAGVEVCLVVRSATPVARHGLTAQELTRHVGCDGSVQTAGDGHLRRSFRTLVTLPNARPVRPQAFRNTVGVPANPYTHLHE